eukprot:CAMPEP_0203755104 /NCGR_PEP_ID=MMETSP0098-20131031/8609_1 /ASSEMBLY_ACC=CAM_ASM_000208 /TAXON_ID=96639 /ORGANISM=" , Strain NY0313808BC1" /LENGTH=952 /DNA_ID=CAMNT_0050646431 /DNA_START=469 /DNA_END=3327 /DNA_ORIENTATION=-
MRKERLHTMSPQVASMLKRMGMDDMFNKLKQLDEAAVLVSEGKLKRDVYDALVTNVEETVEKESGGKKKDGVFSELLRNLKPAKEKRDKARNMSVTATETPLLSKYLYKRSTKTGLFRGKRWKKRWVVLYERALVVYKTKKESKCVTSIILTPEFFVQQSSNSKSDNASEIGDTRDDQSEAVSSIREDNSSKREPEFVFMVSDLNVTHRFAVDTHDEMVFWMHTLTSTIRKIINEEGYFDTPQLMGQMQRSPEEIKTDFEKRKDAYMRSQREKTMKRTMRKSYFRKNKKMSEEDWKREEEKWELEGDKFAQMELAKKMLEQEREHVRRLEEAQTEREEELKEAKKAADEWKETAEGNKRKFEEADARAAALAEQEKILQERLALMETMRAQNIEKEEAIRAEQELTEEQLENMQNAKALSSAIDPAAMAQYENEIKALQTKLAALQSALDVDLDGLDWDGTLEDAEEKMKLVIPRLMSENPNEALDAQAEFDQWDKIVRNHADFKKREEQKWVTWNEENREKNLAALEEMRKIVPKQVLTGVSEEFLTGRGLSLPAAKRVMATKILQFIYLDKDKIAKIHIADLSSRYVPQGLDIRELRAIYACLPDEFQNDRDGRKKIWLDQARQKLHQFTEKEKQGKLNRAEELHSAYRSAEDNKRAAAAKQANRPKGTGAPRKKMENPALAAMFAGGGPKKGGPKKGGAANSAVAAMFAAGGPKKAPATDKNTKTSPAAGGSQKGSRKSVKTSASPPSVPSKVDMEQPVKSEPFSRKLKNRENQRQSVMQKSLLSSVKNILNEDPNASDKKTTRPKSNPRNRELTKEQALLAGSVRGMMDSVQKVDVPDFNELDAPAYDFGAYGERKKAVKKQRAGEFDKNIESAISNLCSVIEENGRPDAAEGGVCTITFGELYKAYKDNTDKLVGLLMRAKKRKRIKYSGDFLFIGIHDSLKVTLMH